MTEGPGQPGAENKPNPFENIVEAKWTGFKLDVIADSSLIFTVGPETPGVTCDEKGKLKAPEGWKSSLGGIHETMKNFQTVSGLIDILAEGAATCEQLTAVAKELLERKPKIACDEKAESRIARIIIVVWNGNDCASSETAKGGVLYKAKPISDAMKMRAKELQDVLKNYDGGMLIGPASAKTWKLESSWETGAESIARLMKPPQFHYWRAETFWDSVEKWMMHGTCTIAITTCC